MIIEQSPLEPDSPAPSGQKDQPPGRWPESPGSSVWPVGQRNLTMQRRGRFVPESGQHPGRMSPALAAEAIRRFTSPGDVVLDPMCGIGTTLVEAIHAGRHAVGVECESRWVAVARANAELAAQQGGGGNAVVVTGDARHLDDLISVASPASGVQCGGGRDAAEQAARAELGRLRGRVRLLLTSPPYGASTHGRVEFPGGAGPAVARLFQHYTDAPGRRRRPRSSRGPGSRRALVNLAQASPAELLPGLSDIFAASLPLLAPDAAVVVTARPYRRDGLLIDLPGLVAQAGENAGLHLADRHVALLAGQQAGGLTPRHSFLQLLHMRWARERGDDWLLIAHEDVLIFHVGLQPDELQGGTNRIARG